jgi:hypothetical protein
MSSLENSQIFSQAGEWFWTMCQFFVVSITLFLILRQIRLQNDSHLVNSFACLESRWNSLMMLQSRRLTCERFKPNITSMEQPTAHLGYFFEEIGVYCRRGILDKEVIWEMYSFHIEHYWIMAKNSILCFRKECGDGTFYKNFEYLYNEMLQISRKKGAPTHEKTSEDIVGFIGYELGIVEFLEHTKELSVSKDKDISARTKSDAT